MIRRLLSVLVRRWGVKVAGAAGFPLSYVTTRTPINGPDEQEVVAIFVALDERSMSVAASAVVATLRRDGKQGKEMVH